MLTLLFSFYNQHSSFTHGGLDPDPSKDDVLIIGQKNIHDKIQQLNFRDCHAKISYVDAQATLGDGVVVQVSGELSNDGHPMRRFTQTFVLACQSPKKYYVHNDIFRYQDMYNEDDEAAPRAGDEHDTNESNVTTASSDSSGSMIVPQTPVYYQAPANVVSTPPIMNYPSQTLQGQASAGQVNGVLHDEMLKSISTQTGQAPPQILQSAQLSIIAQVAQSLPMAPAAATLPLPVEPVAVVSDVIPTTPIMIENNQYDADQSNGEIINFSLRFVADTIFLESETDTLDNSKETDTNSEETMQTTPATSLALAAPKNWANLVKGGPGNVFSASAPQPDVNVVSQPQSFVAITQQQQQQAQQQQKVQSDNFGISDRRRNNNERERRTSGSTYNSSSQDGNCSLFLGNLPTRATEDELRQMFSVFGKITELRIHNKSSQNRQVPNFGFIKFEDPASALKLQESTVSDLRNIGISSDARN